jgi:hypothetical protein
LLRCASQLPLLAALSVQMKKWPILLVLVVILCFATLKLYGYFRYNKIEVSNYAELMKKAEYGQISHRDLRVGAFDLIENSQCKLITEDLTRECLKEFEISKEPCAKGVLDSHDIKDFDEHDTLELLRQFNLCRQNHETYLKYNNT